MSDKFSVYSFGKIHENWIPIFKKNLNLLHESLKSIIDNTEYNKITPTIDNIFNTFIINPLDIKVIIVGQDPYPKEGDANGLSFSTNSKTTPASLKNIFSCLNRLGYTTKSNNLMSWLLQGVLLLNSSLTTQIGHTKKHSIFWNKFINEIISEVTYLNKKQSISILLWGNDAQNVEKYVRGKHKILKWSHPSPIADNQLIDSKKFINCTNFDDIKGINWSTGNDIYLYTDGSGSPCSDCISAVYIQDLLEFSICVKPSLYEITEEGLIISKPNTKKEPTSQRAEYLAIIYALIIIHNLNLDNVEIITDSRNAHGIITEWTKRKEEKYENADLVKIMRALYNNKIIMKHVLSHNKSSSIHNNGNNIVDALTKKHIQNNKDIYEPKIKYLNNSFKIKLNHISID